MHLVQILLPLTDNHHHPFPSELYAQVRRELTDRFGGLTAYVRSPATGLWKEESQRTVHDDIVIYEVMTNEIDRAWWKSYRLELARRYHQDELIVRVSAIEIL